MNSFLMELGLSSYTAKVTELQDKLWNSQK